jgi:4-hydroxy-2-oxoheptanedioate aldolase
MELKKRLLTGAEPLLGAFLGLPSPALTEMIGLAGFDLAILEAEHGAFDLARIEECLRAATSIGISCVVRVGELNSHAIQTVLDLGAEGIQVPQVESAEEAREAVEFSHFSPAGMRGFGSATRAADYGFHPRSRVIADAREKTVVCVQIESRAGVENLPAIVDTPGVDVVFIGTSDLSLAYGLDSPTDPKVNALVDEMVPTIVKARKVAGIYSGDRSRQDHLLRIGVRYFTVAAGILAKEAFQQATQSFAGMKAKSFAETAAQSNQSQGRSVALRPQK